MKSTIDKLQEAIINKVMYSVIDLDNVDLLNKLVVLIARLNRLMEKEMVHEYEMPNDDIEIIRRFKELAANEKAI